MRRSVLIRMARGMRPPGFSLGIFQWISTIGSRIADHQGKSSCPKVDPGHLRTIRFLRGGSPIYVATLAPHSLPHSLPQLQTQPVFFVPQLQADFVHSSHSIPQFPLPEGRRCPYLSLCTSNASTCVSICTYVLVKQEN